MQVISIADRMRLEAGLSILRKKDAHNTAQNSPKATKTDANEADNNLSTRRPKHGSVGVLVVEDGCILSGTRLTGFNPGLVCGPGGHVEDGETHEQAAIRETQEEFGITPKGLIQIGLGPWEPDTGLKPAVFLATEYEGTLRNTDGEMGDLRFRSLAELREMDKAMFQPFADAIDLMLQIIGPDHFDGGPGSGNHNHKGVPGQRGGSAPSSGGSTKKGSSKSSSTSSSSSKRQAVNGKNIAATYSGSGDIKSVLKTQGYDGLPKLAKQDEFDKAVKESNFVAQRGYVASSQEVLDSYRDALYNGEFYVECEGGSDYGKGMYCAANYNGDLDGGVKGAAESYGRPRNEQTVGCVETLTLEPDAKIGSYNEIYSQFSGQVNFNSEQSKQIMDDYTNEKFKEIGDQSGKDAETYVRWYSGDTSISWGEVSSAVGNIGTENLEELNYKAVAIKTEAQKQWENYAAEVKKNSDEIRAKFDDIGSYAAALGYDAIKADNFATGDTAFTVILNRTKVIFLDNESNADSADKGKITFRLGNDGIIYAIRDGKAIGWVQTSYAKKEKGEKDSHSDSLMSASNLASAFNFAISKNRDKNGDNIDLSSKNGIIKLDTPSTYRRTFQTLAPEDIAFIADEFGVDVSSATDEELAEVCGLLHEDGAPYGNKNAAGPHKRQHLSSADKAKYSKRLIGQKTSDGVEIKKIGDHAFDRIAQRNLSPKRIENMLASSNTSTDKKHPETRRCYDVPGSRLVLDHTDGTIVTIEWRRQNK